MQLQRAENFII